ncbi:MAG: flavodoxin [Bacteroidetes bacterium GWF2_42_66]|nr:MAG: flavodoxin [Bacteroidetes bacterium GWA2_42_15]OFX98659.1 MAG: flavodoxin [Bacteroidetes bacterium GWE2_42_39]OFY43143.1 MAG: flavodoxin [Bacteroidetes bacterium GWF2_42_66]HBL77007.1 flavodoxin [Prolixibacteraceae bacterium]HCR90097.1 flavodoxin [Prolixibacteraceae bacterium]
MKKTAIIYSFNSNKTAKAAEKIVEAFGNIPVEKVNAEEIDKKKFLAYDNLILGVPTWFDGELPNYWDEFVPELEDLDLKGKTIALYGLGDQHGYPENFGDAVGIMYEILVKNGAKVIGFTSAEDYSYEYSRAEINGKFAGLLLDQENQARLSGTRIKHWVEDLLKEFK